MRLVLVLPDLGLGGAQRVALGLAEDWLAAGCAVDLVTISAQEPVFPLPAGAGWHPVCSGSAGRGVSGNFMRAIRLRRLLTQLRPDAVISLVTTANVTAMLAGVGRPWRTIISERSDPAHTPVACHWAILRRLIYPWASAVVFQTQTAARALGLNGRTVVIPNPVAALPRTGIGPTLPSPYVLAVGRLTKQKGFDLLIDAFARVAAAFPHWHLIIAGEGELRQALSDQVVRLNLEARIHLPGFIAGMGDVYHHAGLFVLPSRFEGYPNALCEAMAAGLPVIAADCPSGPADIIRKDIDGLLIATEDERALVDALRRLMGNAEDRRLLGVEAGRITERLTPTKVMSRWRALLGILPVTEPEQDPVDRQGYVP